jgi:hypothetical protein
MRLILFFISYPIMQKYYFNTQNNICWLYIIKLITKIKKNPTIIRNLYLHPINHTNNLISTNNKLLK